MNGIIGLTDLLLDGTLAPEQRRRALLLKDSGNSLLAIINDILDVSKIEAGRLELERIPLSPATTVESAVAIVSLQAVAKGLEIKVELATDLPSSMLGDPTRLRQILLNLLTNAVKFTEQGQIHVRVGRETESATPKLRFEVADTGIGIPADRLNLLFQVFSQVDRSINRRFGGTGLGLAICKRLAEGMGGTIGVNSRPGEGSVFWFTIDCVETQNSHAAASTAPDNAGGGKLRILVAEDLYVNQLVVEAMLGSAGHEVTLVRTGAEAVTAVGDGGFDLVLMDVEMPEMDGIAATRAIRSLGEPGGRIPIIALTANAMPEEMARCRAAGMNAHLAKPIDREALLRLIAQWACAAVP